MSDPIIEIITRLSLDTGRIASSLEALVHHLGMRDSAPRVICTRPESAVQSLAPVNLANEQKTLFITLKLASSEPATVGPITVYAGDATAVAMILNGSARLERAQIDVNRSLVATLAVGPEMYGALTAHPQPSLELRVRVSPGTYPGGTIAVIPLQPVGMVGGRLGWVPHDAYDAPEGALRN